MYAVQAFRLGAVCLAGCAEKGLSLRQQPWPADQEIRLPDPERQRWHPRPQRRGERSQGAETTNLRYHKRP
eukprot:777671-Pleurochrysis_carterae.AAC.2